MAFHVPNRFRIRNGRMASNDSFGNNGAFAIRIGNAKLNVIASDGEGWEHVSVSLTMRCPNWNEMCAIKALFWDEEDCVVQFHPPRSQYVNVHPYCLHMWRPTDCEIGMPPKWMVG